MSFKRLKTLLLLLFVANVVGLSPAMAEQYEYSERMSDAELDQRINREYGSDDNKMQEAMDDEFFESSPIINRKNRFYLGGGIGQSYLDIDPNGSRIDVSDDSDLVKEIFAGFSFNKYFSVEGYYTDFGNAELERPGAPLRTFDFQTDGDLDYYSYGLTGLLAYPIFADALSEALRVFVKVGYSGYESDGSDLGKFVDQDSDSGVHFGGGLEYALTDNIALRAHYTSVDSDDAQYWAGNIVYYFGKPAEPVEKIEPVVAPQPTPQQQLIELAKNVYFITDKAALTNSAMRALDSAADILDRHRELNITIGAHTDSRGSDKYNLNLSERRAKSVARYLISRGVSASRMASRGFGESRPIATNNTPEGRAQNRRVEIRTVN